jgi:serine phosphatase RsbU (regulator of sigma subunit)/pSer/pThr/pTyr-binding forkhead associated (FHA) protein
MATLITLQGPNPGRPYTLDGQRSLIGRRPDSTIFLESLAVSREHAEIVCEQDQYFVEDLKSSNGTYVNGKRISGRVPLTERDTLQIGPYSFGLRPAPNLRQTDSDQVIRSQVNAVPSNLTLYSQNPGLKLQVVLEIAQHLARTLETDPLVGKLLDHLFRLFPQADRGMVLLMNDRGELVVRAQRSRGSAGDDDFPYSRTIVKKALDDGVAILSEDVGGDQRFVATATLINLNLRSLLCVPLIAQDRRRLGVIQLDSSRPGHAFHAEDLELLTTLGLQVSVVLENAALHAELLREERLRQELTMAREIQESFLPTDFAPLARDGFELFARVHPAREVSGDLYDFFPLGDGRLAFFLGDVSGKGMPAAMFMVKVHTLCRLLAAAATGPSDTLSRLNPPLAANNPAAMFVTMAHGIYDPRSARVTMTSAGHPPPLLRHADGRVEELPLPASLPVGCVDGPLELEEKTFKLGRGDTLILYTDGFTEAFDPSHKDQFGVERLRETLGGTRTSLALAACAEEARAAIERFTASPEQQDDLTLLLLRRL